jgi:hypothetical protein
MQLDAPIFYNRGQETTICAYTTQLARLGQGKPWLQLLRRQGVRSLGRGSKQTEMNDLHTAISEHVFRSFQRPAFCVPLPRVIGTHCLCAPLLACRAIDPVRQIATRSKRSMQHALHSTLRSLLITHCVSLPDLHQPASNTALHKPGSRRHRLACKSKCMLLDLDAHHTHMLQPFLHIFVHSFRPARIHPCALTSFLIPPIWPFLFSGVFF